jgi:hypothetical protein
MRQFLAFLFLAPYVMFTALASGPVTAAVTTPLLPLQSVPAGGEQQIVVQDARTGIGYKWLKRLYPTVDACEQAFGNANEALKGVADAATPAVEFVGLDRELAHDLGQLVMVLYRQTGERPALSVVCLPYEPKGDPA